VRFRNLNELLPCVEMEAEGAARGAVIWLHGLGASGHDFEDVVPLLQRPDVRFVFPHAPRKPVTINAGMIMPAWYDILSLEGPRLEEDERGIRSSAPLVRALIERERERGLEAAQIVLAGFSQGGAMALFVADRYEETLAGLMVLSGYELLADTRGAEQREANTRTPLLLCHGLHDPMVPIARGREAFESHAVNGRPATKHEFPMAHQMCMEEIEVIREWLAERFA